MMQISTLYGVEIGTGTIEPRLAINDIGPHLLFQHSHAVEYKRELAKHLPPGQKLRVVRVLATYEWEAKPVTK